MTGSSVVEIFLCVCVCVFIRAHVHVSLSASDHPPPSLFIRACVHVTRSRVCPCYWKAEENGGGRKRVWKRGTLRRPKRGRICDDHTQKTRTKKRIKHENAIAVIDALAAFDKSASRPPMGGGRRPRPLPPGGPAPQPAGHAPCPSVNSRSGTFCLFQLDSARLCRGDRISSRPPSNPLAVNDTRGTCRRRELE